MIINSLVLTSSVAGESPSAEPELAGSASRRRGVCSVGALATSFSSIDMAMGTIVADRLPVRLGGNNVRGKRSKAKVLGRSPTRGAYAEKYVRRNRRSDTLAPSHARVHQCREQCIKACAVLIFYIYFLLFLSFLLPFFSFSLPISVYGIRGTARWVKSITWMAITDHRFIGLDPPFNYKDSIKQLMADTRNLGKSLSWIFKPQANLNFLKLH